MFSMQARRRFRMYSGLLLNNSEVYYIYDAVMVSFVVSCRYGKFRRQLLT